MKFNWGHGITLGIIAFVSFLLFMVYKTTTLNVDLVTEDYYAEEIAYQGQIDKTRNANQLAKQVSWEMTSEGVAISFPDEAGGNAAKGKLHFFRPSNKALDLEFDIATDDAGMQVVPKSMLKPGQYQLRIDWQANQTEYYKEGNLYVGQ